MAVQDQDCVQKFSIFARGRLSFRVLVGAWRPVKPFSPWLIYYLRNPLKPKVSTVRVDLRWRGIDPGAHLDQPLDSKVAQICPLFSYRGFLSISSSPRSPLWSYRINLLEAYEPERWDHKVRAAMEIIWNSDHQAGAFVGYHQYRRLLVLPFRGKDSLMGNQWSLKNFQVIRKAGHKTLDRVNCLVLESE